MASNQGIIEVDWVGDVVGRTLQIALNQKGIYWLRAEGLSLRHGGASVLKSGNQIALGEAAIILALEEDIPGNSFFPNGNRGMPIALAAWRDKVAQKLKNASSDFIVAQAGLVARQMHDGRSFLQGEAPSLADIVSAAWMLQPEAKAVLEKSGMLLGWTARMDQLLTTKPNPASNSVCLEELVSENKVHNKILMTGAGAQLDSIEGTLVGSSEDFHLIKLENGIQYIVSPLETQINVIG